MSMFRLPEERARHGSECVVKLATGPIESKRVLIDRVKWMMHAP